jgi:hypothetical protein
MEADQMSRTTERYNRKVKAQIDKMLENLDAVATSDIVKAIDAKLMFANGCNADATNHRLDAARMYVVLRARIDGERKDWWKWHRDNFARSRKDAAKLLAIGNAQNPEATLEHERASNRERMAKRRAGAHNADVCASNVVTLAIKRIEKEIEKLDFQQRAELWAALREKYHGEIEREKATRDEHTDERRATGY